MNIDFHSHILPCADHGSDSLDTTLKQLEFSKVAAIDTIIATPHFYANAESVSEFLERRDEALHTLAPFLTPEHPKILPAAEILLFPGMENMQELDKLTIAGTDCLLIEMPYHEWDNVLLSTLNALCSSRYTIILAHIDRYSSSQLSKLGTASLLYQINAESFCSLSVRLRLKKYISSDRFTALGSDIHGADKKAYRYFHTICRKHPQLYQTVMARCHSLLFKK